MLKKIIVSAVKLRLDRFLAETMPALSRSRIQKNILAGKVLVNGKVALQAKQAVRIGDIVEYNFEQLPVTEPQHLDLNILYENDDIIILDKPAGLVVHPAPGYKGPTLSQGLVDRYEEIKLVGEDSRPGIVHRLDKETSGVILAAKTARMFDHLKNAFADRRIKKEYIALVCGNLPQKHGFIDAPIGRHPTDFRKMAVLRPENPKSALTEYYVLRRLAYPGAGTAENVDEFTLLRVKLHTGRTHQIRVHFLSKGFPIAGDSLYGKCRIPGLSRQFLHALKIEVQLIDGAWVEAESELPADLKAVISNLREIK